MRSPKFIKINLLIIAFLLQLNGSFSFNYTSTLRHQPRDIAASQTIIQEYYDCSAAQQEKLENAFKEASSVLISARIKLDTLIEGIFDRQPGPKDVITGKQRVVLRTFEAIFGQVYFGQNDKRNEEGLERVNVIMKRVRELSARFVSIEWSSQEIRCSDEFLKSTGPDGEQLPEAKHHLDGPVLRWDSRPAERGGNTYITAYPCVADLKAATFTAMDPSGGAIDVIFFCTDKLDQWSSEKLIDDNPYERKRLDRVLNEHATGVLIHEISHSQYLLPGLDTEDVEIFGEVAYSWAAVGDLARNDPKGAVKNAAMYLDKKSWDRCFALPIPSDQLGWVGTQ